MYVADSSTTLRGRNIQTISTTFHFRHLSKLQSLELTKEESNTSAALCLLMGGMYSDILDLFCHNLFQSSNPICLTLLWRELVKRSVLYQEPDLLFYSCSTSLFSSVTHPTQ